jgi:hypothetical protein
VRALAALTALALAGCSASFEFGRPKIVPPPPVPAGGTAVIEPNGEIIEQAPPPAAIDTVITAMGQAQQLRTLVRQLAR